MTAAWLTTLRAYPPGSLTESQLDELWQPMLDVIEAAEKRADREGRCPLCKQWAGLVSGSVVMHADDCPLAVLSRAVTDTQADA